MSISRCRLSAGIIHLDEKFFEVLLSKRLTTKTDLRHQLLVPTEALGDDKKLIVGDLIISFDQNGKQWKFPLATRKTDRGKPSRYKKPTIPPGSWHPFVQEFGLRADDAVIFYIRKHDIARKIQVRAMRKAFLLMGKKVWKEVEKVDNQASTSQPRTPA
ncbi:hypothetical protein GH714_019059 [Hevea brasiliensis]|uniref:TF-B3 domain-containing protein n=1 Tax=Hevea brasiliensis TaxID=3981 RepID=A0A6A6N294_HEVBR|nr:hypothetical protein GH714_018900 [Hevea brasiliensis]KAF2319800.1 hypothetical protein GH714_019059 [Hevea brasiliensis]